ncbi:mastermind-like protein 1 isoform 2-T2 [Polymixia lowei]
MERLRRRIELFRRHHNSCENRYENTALERLELERQHTFALHQRCLQTKAKRSNKHRQSQPSSDQSVPRGPGTGVNNADLGDSGTPGEQSRNSTLIALQETVKRKLESAGSPLGREQLNGFSDTFPPSKKACLDNGKANGSLPPHSPLDSKLGIGDSLVSNGTHASGGECGEGAGHDLRLKEMKQEPDDILPCMLPSGGGATNSLFPDLNLNEQEWTELMEELNRSVAYEDIQDILNDGFEDRKDPPDLAPTQAGGVGGSSGGGGGSQAPSQPSQGLLAADLASVKAEFSPASAVFEQDSRTGSPHIRPTSSGPPSRPTSSPVATSSASSPALPQHGPSRQHQPPNQLLPPGPPVSKDLSPAQQLQQLAAQQQRAQQHLHNQLQHKQQAAKFHPQGPHPPSWPQTANPSQSPLGGTFGMDKPSSPSLYPQDFNPNTSKQLLMPGQPNKGSPKAGAGGYMQGSGGNPNMLGHPASGAPLSHPASGAPLSHPASGAPLSHPASGAPLSHPASGAPLSHPASGAPLSHPASGAPLSHPAAAGGQAPSSMLSYNNTKPLSHFEAGGPGPGPPRGPPNAQSQNKAALLSLIRQQQQMKQKTGMPFRPHLPHTQQEQNAYPAPQHGPGSANAMATQTGGSTMATQPGGNGMPGNHGNAAYLSGQAAVAAALKQQQQHHHQHQQHHQQHHQHQQQQQQQMPMLEHQKQYLLGQRRLMTEQEKQRQQQDQLQRHLTRPPPQYQDQPAQTSQNPFQQVNTFTASSQSMGSVGSMGGPAPGAQRMFPQNQGMMGINMGQGGGPASGVAPPPVASQADMNLPSCGGGSMDVQQVLYNNMSMHPSHPPQPGSIQRQPLGPMSASYRHNLLAQQHLKNQPNAALLKQQLATRLPGSITNSLGGSMPASMPSSLPSSMPAGLQSQAWQQQQHQGMRQVLSQPPSSNGGLPPNAFPNPPNPFHMQQPRMPKLPPGTAPFGASPGARPLGGMNPGQQMMQANMAAQQRAAANPQALGQSLANQQQTQQPAGPNQTVLPDLGGFTQSQGNGRQGLQCSQGYQVSRSVNQQQQQLSFGYTATPGGAGLPSFPGESDLVDSLLKGQSTQEWMDDLDELLASHH